MCNSCNSIGMIYLKARRSLAEKLLSPCIPGPVVIDIIKSKNTWKV